MQFKRSGKRVFGVIMNASEQAAFDEMIRQELVDGNRSISMDMDAIVLDELLTKHGFSIKKLRKFWENIYRRTRQLEDVYELQKGEGASVCRIHLKDKGVDLEQWYRDIGFFKNPRE